MKVSGRKTFSTRPLADDRRKQLLCVIMDQSCSRKAAFCHFQVCDHLHAVLVKCPSQLLRFFFLPFFLGAPTSSKLSRFIFHASELSVSAGLRDHANIQQAFALHFSRFRVECQRREGSRRRRHRPRSLPCTCDFVTLQRQRQPARSTPSISSSPPLVITLLICGSGVSVTRRRFTLAQRLCLPVRALTAAALAE